jgi:hypothetical protein
VWQYQLGEPNAYRTEYLGDTDGDNLNEFMVSASSLFGGNGSLFALFESRGDNSYEMVFSTVIPKYQLTDGDMIVGNFDGQGLDEIALCTGKNIVILSAESDDEWIEKLKFKSSTHSSEFFYYQRFSSESPVIINIIRPTWETYVLKILDGFIPGDTNNDNLVNGNDVVFFVDYIKNGGVIDEPIIRADANGDCTTNLLDVSYLVDYFKGRLPAPQPGWCHFYTE